MKPFDVYPLFDINPIYAKDVWIYDAQGNQYLDLYGGHAVISIGHNHPEFLKALKHQLDQLMFYSNSVINNLQTDYADALGDISNLPDYQLFLCNSGAEAIENALKIASFHTNKKRVLSFKNGFHGRTSAAIAVSDYDSMASPLNRQHLVTKVALEDYKSLEKAFKSNDIAAVIIEPIQGVGGLDQVSAPFFKFIEFQCRLNHSCLIVDEIQSGSGRTGKYFAFQHHEVKPDLITMAKGIGNGYPLAGVLIDKDFESKHGLLGTTFGGNHLANKAGISVIEILKKQRLMQKIPALEHHFRDCASNVSSVIKVKGKGLMLGLEFDLEISKIRKKLLYDFKIFTGGSANKRLLRILPPLTIKKQHIDKLFNALERIT
ncbi:MAG: aspartate aminotransferase family protein [Flavobacteriaceae bacterium]|nr:aspartate aminotransferase family protein [Flavobacteriaceae bacterium]